MNNNLKPLNVNISKCVVKGKMYDLASYEEYASESTHFDDTAIKEKYKDKEIILPYRGKYQENISSSPGIYDAGPIDFIIYPADDKIDEYVPDKIISMNNQTDIKEMLEKKETIARLDEPWITSPDNITKFTISEDDSPEMKCLKMALNEKKIDFDKYGSRFGANFPNDKRQLKNNTATLKIIKRFCEHMDMEPLLTLRDKNQNVPNPMGTEITISLLENYSEDDEEE